MAMSTMNTTQESDGKKEPIIASINAGNYEFHIRDYELNVAKSIEKKMIASDRSSNFVFDEKPKCFVITLSAAAYEMMKQELNKHYASEIKRGEVLVCEGKDKSDNRVDVALKVDKGYTINLYNTTSRLMVNGKNYKRFRKVYETIRDDISKEPLGDINHSLHQQLLKASESLQRNEYEPHDEVKSLMINENEKKNTDRQRQSERQLKKSTEKITPLVMKDEDCVCGFSVESNDKALACSACKKWIHMSCDPTITNSLYKEHQDNPNKIYCCIMCEYNITTDAQITGSKDEPEIWEDSFQSMDDLLEANSEKQLWP